MLTIRGWSVTPSRSIRVPDGGSICVRELPGPEGAPTVLLLHGLGATAGLQYTPLLHQMSEHYRVLAVDMRRPRTRTDGSRLFSTVAADAVAALDDAGVDRAVVLGYSIGGLVARSWRATTPTGYAASSSQRPSTPHAAVPGAGPST